MSSSTAAAVPSRAAPAASAADERRSAATASVALYGFVAWIGTHIAFVLFVLWAYLPERVLHRLGVLYYPSQYWALALPCHLMVSVAALYAAYWIYNLSRLPPLDDFANVIDEFSNAPDERDLAARGQQERIPPIYDLPITHVNAVLFPRRPAGRAGASSLAG